MVNSNMNDEMKRPAKMKIFQQVPSYLIVYVFLILIIPKNLAVEKPPHCDLYFSFQNSFILVKCVSIKS